MKTVTINGITLTVRHSDAAFAKYDIPASMPAAMVENVSGEVNPVVYTTTGFGDLTSESQVTIMAHEAGHVACGHLEMYNEEGVLYDIPDAEAQADAWAMRVVGVDAFERALEDTLALIKRQLGDALTPEIEVEMHQQIAGRITLSQKYM